MRFFYTICFALLIGFASWTAYGLGYERFERSARATSSDRLSLYQATLRSTLARVSHLPKVAAIHPYTVGVIQNGTNLDAFNQYLETVSDSAGSAALYVLDADGTTLAASNHATSESFVGNNYRFRRYYTEAIRDGKATFFAVGVTTGRPGYFLSEAVKAGGKVIGVAVVKVEFKELLNDWRTAGENVLISNEDGVVVLASNANRLYKMLREVSPERLAEMKESRKFAGYELERLAFQSADGVFDNTVDLDGQSFAVSTVATAGLGWNLHFLTPLAPVHSSALALAGVVFLLLGFAGIGILYAKSRVERGKLQIAAVEADRVRKANTLLEKEIFERKKTEERLRETQAELIQSSRLAALGKMSAAIVHEVNQPVSAIRTFTSSGLLLLREKRLPEAGDVFDQIRLMTERLGAITSDLLIFSRKPVSRPASVDLNRCVAEIVTQQQPIFDFHDVKLNVSLLKTPAQVRGSKVRFEQLIGNLLKNAMQACEGVSEGQVLISIHELHDEIVLSVSDNGAGVDVSIKDQLFDPFFTTKDIGEGVGLGLALCYAIADEANGKIKCENLAEGGACFTVELPKFDEGVESSGEKANELVDS